jgi:hypothetical protein
MVIRLIRIFKSYNISKLRKTLTIPNDQFWKEKVALHRQQTKLNDENKIKSEFIQIVYLYN